VDLDLDLDLVHLPRPLHFMGYAGRESFLLWGVKTARCLLKEGRTIRVEIIKRKKFIWNFELLMSRLEM
jgi:hypothetical protein